jgi:hypothetical protein
MPLPVLALGALSTTVWPWQKLLALTVTVPVAALTQSGWEYSSAPMLGGVARSSPSMSSVMAGMVMPRPLSALELRWRSVMLLTKLGARVRLLAF